MTTYSSADAARLCGVTYRQLDYWTRCGLVEPTVPADGSGTRRRWTDDDLVRIRRVRLASVLSSGSLLDVLDRLDDLEASGDLADLAAGTAASRRRRRTAHPALADRRADVVPLRA